MGKSSDNRPVFNAICWIHAIIVCVIAGLMAKTAFKAILAGESLVNWIAPLVGSASCFLGLLGVRWLMRKANADHKREKEIMRLHPEEPWLWQSKWADGKMTTSNKGMFVFQLSLSAIVSLVGGIGLVLCWLGIIKGGHVSLLSALVTLAGLIYALCFFIRYRKFGESTFQMACMPGIVGGELAGVLHTEVSQIPAGGFVLTLQSIKHRTTGRGRCRRTHREVLWEDKHNVSIDLNADTADGKVVLPVSFAIPFECESCSEKPTASTKLFWELSADAEFPGADFHCKFDVPVFKTPESQKDFQLSTTEQSFSNEISLANLCAESGVKHVNDNEMVSFEFPLARRIGEKLVLTMFTIIFSSLMCLAPIVCGILTLASAAATIRCWFWYGKISADEHGVQILTGFLGLRSHQFSRDQIKSLIYRELVNGQTQEFDLLVETTEHEKPTLFGTLLKGETAARRLCQALESALNMSGISKKVGRKKHLPKGLKDGATTGFGASNQAPHGA